MNTNTVISDDSLQLVFTGKRMSSKFQYEIIFQNVDVSSQLSFKTIWANNKEEATKFANEYGIRFIDSKTVSISRVAN